MYARKEVIMADVKKAVLLVDDDVDLIEQIRAVVAQEYNVDVAYSGEEALGKIGRFNYDCIVMDVMMQTLSDGLDTAKRLKTREETKGIPIVMLTGVNQHFDYRTQIDGGYFPNDRWLNKPVDARVLLKEIQKLVN